MNSSGATESWCTDFDFVSASNVLADCVSKTANMQETDGTDEDVDSTSLVVMWGHVLEEIA